MECLKAFTKQFRSKSWKRFYIAITAANCSLTRKQGKFSEMNMTVKIYWMVFHLMNILPGWFFRIELNTKTKIWEDKMNNKKILEIKSKILEFSDRIYCDDMEYQIYTRKELKEELDKNNIDRLLSYFDGMINVCNVFKNFFSFLI